MMSEDKSVDKRRRLRELLERGGNIRSTNLNELEKIKEINAINNQSNSILKEEDIKKAKNLTEVAMDAQIIKMNNELLRDLVNGMANMKFSDEEYYNALANVIYKTDEDWNQVAKIACEVAQVSKFRATSFRRPEVSCSQKKQKVVRHRSSTQIAKETQPENVTKIEKQDECLKKVNIVYNEIKRLYNNNNKTPIPFYKLIIDPEDFMNTVDNAFQIAFLVKDNRLIINNDENDLPVVQPAPKQSQENLNVECTGFCSFNPAFINKMIKKYNIKNRDYNF